VLSPRSPACSAEVARVLRRGGLLIAATNGRGHLRELWELAGGRQETAWFEGFSLENGGQQLEQFFANVEVRRFQDSLEITEVEPLLAFIRSLGDRTRDLDEIAETAEAAIARDGSFHVTKSVGLFRCRKR
jgi:hypothetical protein